MEVSPPGTSRASGDAWTCEAGKRTTTFSLARMCSRGNDNKAHGRLFGQSCAGRGTPPTRSAGTPLTRASILFARKSYEDDGLHRNSGLPEFRTINCRKSGKPDLRCHKRVHARLQRAMPGNDDLNSAQCPGMTT